MDGASYHTNYIVVIYSRVASFESEKCRCKFKWNFILRMKRSLSELGGIVGNDILIGGSDGVLDGLGFLGGEGGVLDPVVDSGGEEPVHDDETDVGGEVEEEEEEVLPGVEDGGGVSGHDERHESNPLEGEGSETGHGHGTGESSSGKRSVSGQGDDPRDTERHPGGDEHVNHGLMELVELNSSSSSGGGGGGGGRFLGNHVEDNGDDAEDIGDNTVDHDGGEIDFFSFSGKGVNSDSSFWRPQRVVVRHRVS